MASSYQFYDSDYEIQSITQKVKGQYQEEKKKSSCVSFTQSIALLAVFGLCLLAISAYKYTTNRGSSSSSSSSSVSDGSRYWGDYMSITTSNEYGQTQASMFPYAALTDTLLAEPYKQTLFTIADTVAGAIYTYAIATSSSPTQSASDFYASSASSFSSEEESDVIVTGSVVASSSPDVWASSSTAVFSANLTKVGWYTLTIVESIADVPTRSFSQLVVVKYVRREISDLTDEDRAAFLDAFHTLWEVDTVTGQDLYGENYKSLHFFASVHNDAGGNPVCDEFHGGAGFLNNHVMLGSYLEQSMQLVDPSTCLHYMEYSKYFSDDAFQQHLENQLDGGTWTPLLTEEFFGSSDPETGRILDGRWMNQSIPFVDEDFFTNHGIDPEGTFFPKEQRAWKGQKHLTSPYGLLRSPWNYNPHPYVTRYNALNGLSSIAQINTNMRAYYNGVTCDQYGDFIEDVKGQPLGDYLTYAEDDVHGIIHFTFGGAGGPNANAINKQLKDDYGFTDSDLMLVTQSAQVFYKVTMAQHLKQKDFALAYNMPYPLSCSDWPYDYTTYELRSDAEVGTPGGPTCTLASDYVDNEDNLNLLVDYYFSLYKEGQEQYDLVEKVKDMDLATREEVMTLLVSRLSYDGEMAGSGAAQDPLFWVAHGAVERLLQQTIFANILSDLVYVTPPGEVCSGHVANQTKTWLTGFYFQDENIAAETVSNEQLVDILNPLSDYYGEMVSYVYADSDYNWCEGSEDWFSM